MESGTQPRSFDDFCPKCEHYDTEFGVCRELKENVREYPEKFKSKCNGSFFVQRADVAAPGEQTGPSDKTPSSTASSDSPSVATPEKAAQVSAGTPRAEWVAKMETRLTMLEQKIPRSDIISHSFWRRAWTVFGYGLATAAVIYGVIAVFALLIGLITAISR